MSWKKNRLTKFAEITLIGPVDGWKPQTYYIVDVSWSAGNPIHHAILHTRGVNNSTYPDAVIWKGGYEEPHGLLEVKYSELSALGVDI